MGSDGYQYWLAMLMVRCANPVGHLTKLGDWRGFLADPSPFVPSPRGVPLRAKVELVGSAQPRLRFGDQVEEL